MSVVALNNYLSPVQDILNDTSVNELIINKSGEVWIEKKGLFERQERPDLDFEHLKMLATLIAQSTHQVIDETQPLLAATLPEGYRIQCVIPPACPKGNVIIAIRRQTHINLSLTDYQNSGAFDHINTSNNDYSPVHEQLKELYEQNDFKGFISEAIKNKVTFIVSGGTSTGKTTFINACLAEIPENDRLVIIEDARELFLKQSNIAHLLYSKGGQGLSKAGAQDLLEASLRLRPDRIILGELRGAEAATFLRAINTGHEGSISSIHADTPRLAYEQIALMVMQAGLGLERSEVIEYIKGIIPIVIQLKRGNDGSRYISEIYYDRMD